MDEEPKSGGKRAVPLGETVKKRDCVNLTKKKMEKKRKYMENCIEKLIKSDYNTMLRLKLINSGNREGTLFSPER